MTVIKNAIVINTEIHYHDEAKIATIIVHSDKYTVQVTFNRIGINLLVSPKGVNGTYSLRSKNGVWTSEICVTDVSYAIFTIEFIEEILSHILSINVFDIKAGDKVSDIFPYQF